jgi:hypothetical protein
MNINGKSENEYDSLLFGSIEGETIRYYNNIFERKRKLFKEENTTMICRDKENG